MSLSLQGIKPYIVIVREHLILALLEYDLSNS